MQTAFYFLLVIGPLIFIHELGHFLIAKWRGVRVERFSLGYPPRLFGVRRGDTDYCVSAIPLGGYVKMAGENPEETSSPAPDHFSVKSVWERAQIIVAGPLANLALAFVLYCGIVWLGGELAVVDAGLRVGVLKSDWPAQLAGLRENDLIIALDGQPVSDFDGLRRHVGSRAGFPLALSAVRGSDTLVFNLVPKATTDPESGKEVGQIGLSPKTAYRPVGPWQALVEGARLTWQNTIMVAGFFGRFVSGGESVRNLGGPLFIATVAGEVAEQGWRMLFGFMAILSINLVILNLLPIPVLDGGQLLFLGIEKLRGTPLSLSQRIRVQQVGVAFLFLVIILVTINDLMRALS